MQSGYPRILAVKNLGAACRYMKRRFGTTLDPEREVSSNIGSKEAILIFQMHL